MAENSDESWQTSWKPRCWDVWVAVTSLKRTTRWHEDEMCFSWSGGTRYVTELTVLLGLTDTRFVTMTRTPGTNETGGNAHDTLEQLDTFQG